MINSLLKENKSKMTDKEDDKSSKLKDGSNYHGWLRQVQNLLDEKDLLDDQGNLLKEKTDKLELPAILKKQRILVTKHIHPDLLEIMPTNLREAKEILDYLKTKYGMVNHLEFLAQLKEMKMSTLDPKSYLNDFDKTYAKLNQSGGNLDLNMVTLFLLGGLDPWYAPYTGPRVTAMRNTTVNQKFLDDTKEGIRIHYADTPKPQNFKANNASHERGKQNKPKFVKKHCEICKEMGRNERAVASHTRDEHRDIPPRTRQVKTYHQEEAIKEDANYFFNTQTIYDTAANKKSFPS